MTINIIKNKRKELANNIFLKESKKLNNKVEDIVFEAINHEENIKKNEFINANQVDKMNLGLSMIEEQDCANETTEKPSHSKICS
jgi:ribonuclease HII